MDSLGYTINALSERTGIDRRTLKRRLADTKPVRIVGGRKYYREEDALEPTTRSPSRNEHNDEHWLAELMRAGGAAALHIVEFMDAWFRLGDQFKEMTAEVGAKKETIENEINMISVAYRKPVAELLLFGPYGRKTRTAERICDLWITFDEINQALLDVDATLNVTPLFSTQLGRELKAAATSKDAKKRKRKFPVMSREL